MGLISTHQDMNILNITSPSQESASVKFYVLLEASFSHHYPCIGSIESRTITALVEQLISPFISLGCLASAS